MLPPKCGVLFDFRNTKYIFINKYSSLWSKLPQQLQIASQSSITFNGEVRKIVSVPLLLNLYHPCSLVDQVCETGLGFWKTPQCHRFVYCGKESRSPNWYHHMKNRSKEDILIALFFTPHRYLPLHFLSFGSLPRPEPYFQVQLCRFFRHI